MTPNQKDDYRDLDIIQEEVDDAFMKAYDLGYKRGGQQTAHEMKEYFRSLIFEHLNDFVIEKCNISDLKEERDFILKEIKQKYLGDNK